MQKMTNNHQYKPKSQTKGEKIPPLPGFYFIQLLKLMDITGDH